MHAIYIFSIFVIGSYASDYTIINVPKTTPTFVLKRDDFIPMDTVDDDDDHHHHHHNTPKVNLQVRLYYK